ncbi:hypothetical protein [Actinoplanes sp. NPDC051859]|uniref:hypothetical protein n=1 Tax=Actinoplanes sp. NPDC051859 TaxID=3363909 RepID=UPI003795A34B
MAETDRELGFRKPTPRLNGEPAAQHAPGGFVGLLHGVLTNARMLVHALALICPFVLLVAALLGSPEILAVMVAAMLTLIVWALRRARQEDAARRNCPPE